MLTVTKGGLKFLDPSVQSGVLAFITKGTAIQSAGAATDLGMNDSQFVVRPGLSDDWALKYLATNDVLLVKSAELPDSIAALGAVGLLTLIITPSAATVAKFARPDGGYIIVSGRADVIEHAQALATGGGRTETKKAGAPFGALAIGGIALALFLAARKK